jgi:membrane-associated phospholipid phosphatase
MTPVHVGWQLSVIHAIQAIRFPLLDKLMIGLSWGNEHIYMGILAIILWSVQRRLGQRLLYVFLCSMYADVWLKDALVASRPIGQPGVISLYLSSAKGASMPSGHAQASTTFYGFVAACVRRRWVWLVTIVLLALIGVSRVYLGLHWPMDVIVGWLLGILAVVIGIWFCSRWQTLQGFIFRFAVAVMVPISLLLVQDGNASLQYASYLLGIGVGAVLLDAIVDCDLDGVWWKRIFTSIIGLAGLIALQWMIKWPVTEAGLVLKCTAVGLWGTLGAPLLFLWGGLYRGRGAADAA